MRKLLLAAAALMATFGTAAQAAPDISIRVFQDGQLVQGFSLTETDGSITASGSSSNFSFLAVVAAGSPLVAQPGLIAQSTSISSFAGLSAPSTLRFEITQTSLDSDTAGGIAAQLASSFTANFLTNTAAISNVTLSTYADADNDAFGRDQLLATRTFTTGPTNDSGAIVGSATLPNELFSETVIISATFAGGGAALNASAQIVAVPEPASLALFGMGLLGMGLIRRRVAA